jgi:xanthine phosphoribosyltransferase
MRDPNSIKRPQRLGLGWDEIYRDAARLAALVSGRGAWHGIVAVARGGLVPAALVSRALDIRRIETVSIATYQGEILGAPQLLKPPKAAGDGRGWLVIDDLVDTGVTMSVVRALLPEAHIGVLYAKPAGRPLADTVVRDVPQDVWLDFPWEVAPPA